jgi:hypothetical protein
MRTSVVTRNYRQINSRVATRNSSGTDFKSHRSPEGFPHELGADDRVKIACVHRHRNRLSADDQMMRVPRRGVAYQTAQ